MLRSRSRFQSTAVASALFVTIAALMAPGCSSSDRPALATVHGRVTMNGKPLTNAGIAFKPDVGARESFGATNQNGEYTLKYLRDDMGGAVGKNTVRITNQRNNDKSTETVPAKYNVKTTLEREVKPGDNEINFDLDPK